MSGFGSSGVLGRVAIVLLLFVAVVAFSSSRMSVLILGVSVVVLSVS